MTRRFSNPLLERLAARVSQPMAGRAAGGKADGPATPSGAARSSPGEASRWKDGTPKRLNPKTGLWETDRKRQLEETLDLERIDSQDQVYIGQHEKEIQELMELRRPEEKAAANIIVTDEQAREMNKSLATLDIDRDMERLAQERERRLKVWGDTGTGETS